MLTEIRIENFRCFDNHVIPLRPCTIIVGKNNAGKSTLVDALRLVSIVSSRYQSLKTVKPPEWANLPMREVGVSPSLEGLEFNIDNLFHRYGTAPAKISALFSSGLQLKIYIGPQGVIHAVLFDKEGRVINTKAQAKQEMFSRVEIMPQVAPVERAETKLGPDYIKRNLSSVLAPRHFRNQIYLLKEYFDKFCHLSAETWHGLQIQELPETPAPAGGSLELFLRNDDYVAEVSTMGHGLQMWLQTMWFLSRTDDEATLILDEPDVYMHPDLQRRLIRYLSNHRKQVIVTTHSVEIMSEIDPENILVLDRRLEKSVFATSFPAAQKVLEHVGSTQNLQLARLWNARRTIFVEGDDFKLLCDFYDVVFPDDTDGLSAFPNMSIGGWTVWPQALGSSLLLRNSGGENIVVYCILDSDFHTPAQKENRMKQAKSSGTNLHIWSQKEIENYLIVPSAIHRAITQKLSADKNAPSISQIESVITEAVSSLQDETFDGISNELLLDNRALGHSGANKEARALLPNKSDIAGWLKIVSGKRVFNILARWSEDSYGVSLNRSLLARSMTKAEVSSELCQVLDTIAKGEKFI